MKIFTISSEWPNPVVQRTPWEKRLYIGILWYWWQLDFILFVNYHIRNYL